MELQPCSQLLTNPVGIKLFSYVNTFFCSHKFAQMSATWVKTLYNIYLEGEDFSVQRKSCLIAQG